MHQLNSKCEVCAVSEGASLYFYYCSIECCLVWEACWDVWKPCWNILKRLGGVVGVFWRHLGASVDCRECAHLSLARKKVFGTIIFAGQETCGNTVCERHFICFLVHVDKLTFAAINCIHSQGHTSPTGHRPLNSHSTPPQPGGSVWAGGYIGVRE